LIASCVRTPVTISSTRCAIGWLIATLMFGMSFSFSRIAFSMSVCVQPSGHSLRGLRLTTGSESFCACGSAGDSPRPSFDTTPSTPGTVMIRFMASNSSRSVSLNDMFGTREIAGVIEPSCSVGMNDFPRNGNTAKLAARSRAPLRRSSSRWRAPRRGAACSGASGTRSASCPPRDRA